MSITIDCPGTRATVRDAVSGHSATSIDVGVVVNIPTSSNDPLRTVHLRGLSIDGASDPNVFPSGRLLARGIDIKSAAAVYIEDCTIENVSQQGILDERTGGQTRLYVKDTVISGSGGAGIVPYSAATGITVLDNVSLLNNAYGLAVATGNSVVVNRSTISGNTGAGIEVDNGGYVNVSNSMISHNNTGILYGGGTIRLLDTVVEFNVKAIQGAAVSLGRNTFSGNDSIGNMPSLASGASGDVYN